MSIEPLKNCGCVKGSRRKVSCSLNTRDALLLDSLRTSAIAGRSDSTQAKTSYASFRNSASWKTSVSLPCSPRSNWPKLMIGGVVEGVPSIIPVAGREYTDSLLPLTAINTILFIGLTSAEPTNDKLMSIVLLLAIVSGGLLLVSRQLHEVAICFIVTVSPEIFCSEIDTLFFRMAK